METKCSAFRAILCLTTSTLHTLPGLFWCWDGLVSVLENPNQSLDKTDFYSGRNVPALAAISSLAGGPSRQCEIDPKPAKWLRGEASCESPFLSSFCLLCIDGWTGGKLHVGVSPPEFVAGNTEMLRDSSDNVSHNIRAIASSRLIWISLVLFGRLLINEILYSFRSKHGSERAFWVWGPFFWAQTWTYCTNVPYLTYVKIQRCM